MSVSKKPRFEFRVTDARNFLCFDVTERISPDWFGRIFCNGGAFVKGIPGFIDINANISTAPNSTFTFVLSRIRRRLASTHSLRSATAPNLKVT